jgi:hypothetical protein
MSDIEISSTTDSEEQVLNASGVAPEEKEEVVPPKVEETTEEDDGEEEAPVVKKKGGFQKRIDKLVTRQRELEAELTALKAPKTETATTTEEQAPDPVFFESQAEYIAALVKFETAKAKKDAIAELKAETVKSKEKEQEEVKVSSWQERVQVAHKSHPDLAELLEQDLPVSPIVNDVLIESEIGGELLYYLASNPDELAEISKKGPIAAAKALGLIEDRLLKAAETKPEVKVTQAKKPISPVKSGKGSGGEKSPDDMDLDEYRAWRAKQS